MAVAQLVKWPELERLHELVDSKGEVWEPVEIRFQIKPGPDENWGPELSGRCLVEGLLAPSPAAVTRPQSESGESTEDVVCYAPSSLLKDGSLVTLRVHPRDALGLATSEILWDKHFRVRLDDLGFRLEELE